jgi:hypothetical protein
MILITLAGYVWPNAEPGTVKAKTEASTTAENAPANLRLDDFMFTP